MDTRATHALHPSSPYRCVHVDLRLVLCQFRAHDLRAGHHRLQLSECNLARQVFHPAIRGDEQIRGLAVRQCTPDARSHLFGRFDLEAGEIQDPQHDFLAPQLLEHAAVQIRLRRFDGDLVAAANTQRWTMPLP